MLGLGVSVKSFGVRNRIQVKVRSMVGNSEGTKRLGTKMLGYELSGSPVNQYHM